jgi:hypothetical protein
MAAPVTTDSVWRAVSDQLFAVLSYVTPRGHARSAGIVYVVRDRRLYIGTGTASWKARHIAKNPQVALTVCIAKRVPLMPWIKIPDATISFHGTARLTSLDDTDREVLAALYRGMDVDDTFKQDNVVIEVTPEGDFVTYGVDVSLLTMRRPDDARGRAPVC